MDELDLALQGLAGATKGGRWQRQLWARGTARPRWWQRGRREQAQWRGPGG